MDNSKVTWDYAIDLFNQSSQVHNPDQLVKALKTALNNYVFPVVISGYQPVSQKEFLQFCRNTQITPIDQFLVVFNQQFDHAVSNQKISENTRRSYHYPLNKFINWIQKQIWYQEIFPPSIDQPMPRYRGVRRQSSGRGRKDPYQLKQDSLSELAIQEIEQFKEFWMTPGRQATRRRRGEDPVRESTYQKVKLRTILCFYGWLIKEREYHLESLNLRLMLDLNLIEFYTDWMVDVRGCSSSAGTAICQTAISIAKFLYSQGHNSNPTPSKRLRRNWSDVEIIEDLRDLDHENQDAYQREKKQTQEEKWENKEITHTEARAVVQCLRRYLTDQYHNGRKRSCSAVWWDWQRYFSVKVLTYSPTRQEEIRNWELNKTLFRRVDSQGKPFYEVKYHHTSHKNGSKTQKSRNYKLPDCLTEDLDYWFNYWKPLLLEIVNNENRWLEFWNHDPKKMARLHKTLAKAKTGIIDKNVKVAPEIYIQHLEKKISALQHRIESREIAQKNLTSHDRVFILMGSRKYPESFGLVMDEQNFWSMVTNAVAFATQAIMDQPKRTNPHAFRHIADKHVRKSKMVNIKAFDTLIGHSENQGDQYAEQILGEFEQTVDIADSWWLG